MKMIEDKLIHDLADIYDAEHRFLEAQQEMLLKASAPILQRMISAHIVQTRQQIMNLEQIFGLLHVAPMRQICAAAVGLIHEGQQGLKEFADSPTVRDCTIATAATKVEHYEIAAYRTLIDAFDRAGQQQITALLEANLHQEEETAQLLSANSPALLDQALALSEQRARFVGQPAAAPATTW